MQGKIQLYVPFPFRIKKSANCLFCGFLRNKLQMSLMIFGVKGNSLEDAAAKRKPLEEAAATGKP